MNTELLSVLEAVSQGMSIIHHQAVVLNLLVELLLKLSYLLRGSLPLCLELSHRLVSGLHGILDVL